MRSIRVATTVALVAVVAGLAASPLAASAQAGVPVALADAGEAVAFGRDDDGQIDVPSLPEGMSYTAAAGGWAHTVLLRSDGKAIAFGSGDWGQSAVPSLPGGMSYTAVAAGSSHTLLLRSDGQVIAIGMDATADGFLEIPPLAGGVTYTGVAAGAFHSVLLRSDGQAIAFGWADGGRTDVPELPDGLSYTAVAAAWNTTVLLRSDGEAFVRGWEGAEAAVPPLPEGRSYTDVAAGNLHAVLLRSDGEVFVVGVAGPTQDQVPELPDGVTYTEVASWGQHVLLLRSDGRAVAFGLGDDGQIDVPELPEGMRYSAAGGGWAHSVLIRTAALPATHTVTFDTDGGTSIAPVDVEDGATITAPAAPTRAGYTFGGWRTGSVEGDEWDFDEPVTSSMTLYAAWIESVYTVQFLVDGEYYSAVPLGYGEVVLEADMPEDPEKEGYVFAGWWVEDEPLTVPFTVADNVQVEARWTPVPTPQLVLSRTTAAPGDVVTITGSGFTPGAPVTLTLNPALGTVTPDGGGAFVLAVTVPPVSPGAYAIAARQGSATGPVLASAAISVTARASGLAATGAAEAGGALLAALAALGGGAALAVATRRRGCGAGPSMR